MERHVIDVEQWSNSKIQRQCANENSSSKTYSNTIITIIEFVFWSLLELSNLLN